MIISKARMAREDPQSKWPKYCGSWELSYYHKDVEYFIYLTDEMNNVWFQKGELKKTRLINTFWKIECHWGSKNVAQDFVARFNRHS